jgi:hypothetical protein
MKECERISDLFGVIHDDPEGRIENKVMDHIRGCRECNHDFKWYQLTVQTLNRLEPATPPPKFIAQLNERLDNTRPFSISEYIRSLLNSYPYMPLPVGVTTLFAVVIIGYSVYHTAPGNYLTSASSSTAVSSPTIARETGTTRGVPISLAGNSQSAGAPMIESTRPELNPKAFPSIAEKIGADNLTVESAGVDQAVESLKRILPSIRGKLVDQRGTGMKETVLQVMIPTEAYAYLTTELINHGAVAAGSLTESVKSEAAGKEGNNVLLYIRFIPAK